MKSSGPLLVAVAVALALPAAAQPPAAPSHPIAGAWKLDAERSEDVRELLRARMEKERGSRGGMGGPGGTMGGPGGGMGGPGGGMGGPGGGMGGPGGGRGGRGELDPRAMREAMDEVLGAPEAMAIGATGAEVEIAAQDGAIRRLRADGRKAKHEGGAVTETRTRWDGEVLVNETWLGGRMHVTERFARTAEGELHVEVKVDGGPGEPVTATRVYLPDGAAGEDAS